MGNQEQAGKDRNVIVLWVVRLGLLFKSTLPEASSSCSLVGKSDEQEPFYDLHPYSTFTLNPRDNMLGGWREAAVAG